MKKLYIVLFLLFSCLIYSQNQKFNTYFKLSETYKNKGYIFSVIATDKNGKELTPINTTNNGYEVIYFRNDYIDNIIDYKIKVIQGANDFNSYVFKYSLTSHITVNKKDEPLNQFYEIDNENINKIGGSIFLSGISLQCADLEDINTEKEVN